MSKYANKYKVETNRMPGWDYSRNGYYFITIVTIGMKCHFGTIEDRNLIPSDFGKIIFDEWHKSFKIRTELILDEFVLMPNHLHAIIILFNKSKSKIIQSLDYLPNESQNDPCNTKRNVQTHGRASLSSHNSNNGYYNFHIMPEFHRPPRSISSFIAGFKSITTTKIDDFIDDHHLSINKFNRNNRLWQTNFHDHIIRTKDDYRRIKKYIRENPEKWDPDKNRI